MKARTGIGGLGLFATVTGLCLAVWAKPEVLRFATPLHDAWVDSLACEESIAPVGPLGLAELWQLGIHQPVQIHPAATPGALDSFVLDCQGELLSYFVTTTKASGVRSCPSRLKTFNGRLAVDPSSPGAWLGAPRPNPAQGLVAVPVCLPEAGRASLEVFDIGGRRVACLLAGSQPAGVHLAFWDARHTAAGIYFIVARQGDWGATRRVLVMR